MKNKTRTLPNEFTPRAPRELIGNAGTLAASILQHALRLKRESQDRRNGSHLKCCFYGPRGNGKTTIANLVAEALVNHQTSIERYNGREVTIDLVRQWQQSAAYTNLFGGWSVKIINELDLVPMAAQELMLSYLDQLPAQMAIIGTSNENTDTLSRRFMSRFQLIKVEPPKQEILRTWLIEKWNVPARAADWISLASCGDVREALNQSTSFRQFGVLPEKLEKETIASATCSAHKSAAKQYWAEVRAGLRPKPGTVNA